MFVQRFKRFIDSVIEDDLRQSRLLFFLVSVAFLFFGLYGANVPLKGYIPHRALNYLDALTAFIIFLLLQFTEFGRKHRVSLAYVFIYQMNLINVYLLYSTAFMDAYAYQYIISYVVSAWFFKTKKSLTRYVVVINVAMLIVSFFSKHNSASVIDFYMTYLVSQVVFIVLLRYRFSIEEKLQESEQKYRLIAEHSFDLICVHDSGGKLEFVSPSIKRLLGYDAEHFIGKWPIELLHPDDEAVIRSVTFDKANAQISKPIQFRLKNSEGKYRWFETIFTLLESPDGVSNVALSQTRDISRSKQYQFALEERSRELERSNADLETFAFVSSHDIQEPLRMISNYMQLLKKRYDTELDDQAREYIEFANKGAVHLQHLIRDLLSYSRISRAALKQEPVQMEQLLREVKQNIRLQLEEKKVNIIAQGELIPVIADHNLLMLVVQNLILNGIKYNTSNEPTVTIVSKLEGNVVHYTFTDNGIGIDEKHQQKIFEPFHRLHTKKEYPGTGLGLSICKKIVERLGGSIWVQSQPGNGASFSFTLPAVRN